MYNWHNTMNGFLLKRYLNISQNFIDSDWFKQYFLLSV